jgi:hypothetical protein
MFYQISGIIKSYLKYETLTRFEMNQKQFNPVIVLSISPITIKFKLRKNFPEIKLDEEYINGLKIKDKHMRDVKLYAVFRKYLEKLLNELRFEEFLDVTFGKDFIKSCLIYKNKQVLHCFEINYGIVKDINRINSLTFALVLENKTNSLYEDSDRSVEKIKLNLESKGVNYIALNSRKSFFLFTHATLISANTKTEIGFTSYTYRKLSNSENNCLEDNKQHILRNYSRGNCFFDCLYKNLNQTYGCLPITNTLLYLEFRLHFISRGYRTCDIDMNFTTEELLSKECDELCIPECESVYYNTMVTTQEFKKRNTGTVVEIFPIKYPHFVYIETLNMDFNQLIYNCGGILALWFGLSPLSIDDLVTSLRSSSDRLKSKLFKIINFIIYLFFKLKQIIISILKYLRHSMSLLISKSNINPC